MVPVESQGVGSQAGSPPCRTGAVGQQILRVRIPRVQIPRVLGFQGLWAPQGVHRGATAAERTQGGAEGATSTPHSLGVPAGRHGGGCLRAAGHCQTPGLLQPIGVASSGPGGHNRSRRPPGAR